jgi:hypothetical protein
MFAGYFGSRCGGVLTAAHIYPKGKYPLLELHPLNVVAACFACHLFGWHKSPLDAARWVEERWPHRHELRQIRFEILTRKRMTEDEIRAEWQRYGLVP